MEIPIVDLNTKVISGASPDTFEYFHEEAHLDFNKSNFGQNIQYFFQMSEFYTIIAIVITFFVNFFKWFALIGIAMMIFSFVFEEIYCNYQAREKIAKVYK